MEVFDFRTALVGTEFPAVVISDLIGGADISGIPFLVSCDLLSTQICFGGERTYKYNIT